MAAQLQPRPRLENGRLRHRLPLAAMPRQKPVEPIDMQTAEATVAFFADDSRPTEREQN